ncbi:hypothetical protein CEXT_494651 [Caerostris extrusa]|uniref:Uncharacterized protein n=1 Tax=Caerostris extrusa TaxID=172846 RepID=A0AAV4WZI0_CAEEX|nr:hypothetical protein CEXT_494651 [Caerostris extrusa]
MEQRLISVQAALRACIPPCVDKIGWDTIMHKPHLKELSLTPIAFNFSMRHMCVLNFLVRVFDYSNATANNLLLQCIFVPSFGIRSPIHSVYLSNTMNNVHQQPYEY